MTKTEFLEKYGDAKVTFSSYYKYTFTYRGEKDGLAICVQVGGSADDIYRFSVHSDSQETVRDLEPIGGSARDSDGNTVDEFDSW